MYYAIFKEVGTTEIAVFKTKQERDDWVNFKDPLSLAFRETKENCIFKRMAYNKKIAINKIIEGLHNTKEDGVHTVIDKDELSPNIIWYVTDYIDFTIPFIKEV